MLIKKTGWAVLPLPLRWEPLSRYIHTVTLTLYVIAVLEVNLLMFRAQRLIWPQIQDRSLWKRCVYNLAALSKSSISVQVSDLLREQFFLQSEIGYGSHASSTRHTSRSNSPIPEGGQEREERPSFYRASISITPATPPRPKTEEKQPEEDKSRLKTPEVRGSSGEQENLQQLIKQVKEN